MYSFRHLFILFVLLTSGALLGCDATSDQSAPVVSINNPEDRSTVSGTVQLDVTATDEEDILRVDILLDGTTIHRLIEPPFQVDWEVGAYEDGVHMLQARAYDISMNEGVSSAVAVNVCTSAGSFEAGPIWSGADAQTKCPATCGDASKVWTGHWWTTVPGRMSVCQCTCTNPF